MQFLCQRIIYLFSNTFSLNRFARQCPVDSFSAPADNVACWLAGRRMEALACIEVVADHALIGDCRCE
jgi:hypothetical protein